MASIKKGTPADALFAYRIYRLGFVHLALDEASNDLQNNAANASSCDVADIDAATSSAGCHSEQWSEKRTAAQAANCTSNCVAQATKA